MQKNMTDMEDKETFAHSPRAPGPLLSVIPLSSLLLWAEAPDAVARLTRGWADGATCLPSVSPALLGTRSHLLLPHPSRPPHPPPGRPPQCTRGEMSQHCKSGMSPNGTSRWHYRLTKSRAPSVAACGLRLASARHTALLSPLASCHAPITGPCACWSLHRPIPKHLQTQDTHARTRTRPHLPTSSHRSLPRPSPRAVGVGSSRYAMPHAAFLPVAWLSL